MRAQQQHGAGAIDQDVPDGVGTGDDAFPQRRAGLHDAVGDASGKIVLKERPALPDDVPMILPADEIAEARIDCLIGQRVLESQRGRTDDQHDDGHQHQQTPRLTQRRRRITLRDKGDRLADENRNRRIQQRDNGTGDEQRDDEAFDLAAEIPIKGSEIRWRLGLGRLRRRRQQIFKEVEDRHASFYLFP